MNRPQRGHPQNERPPLSNRVFFLLVLVLVGVLLASGCLIELILQHMLKSL